YSKEVPCTESADETGALARAIGVLKQGAAAMDEQRWVKSNVSKITGEVQGAASLAEFGQRLLSGLVPTIGGGVASVYVCEESCCRRVRLAAYGLIEEAGFVPGFAWGEGRGGQGAGEQKRVVLPHLPPAYLRITSGVGTAPPVQAVALPLLSQDALFGV